MAIDSNGLVLPTIMPETKMNLIQTISRLFVSKEMVGIVIGFRRVTIEPKPVETGQRKVRVSEAPVLMVWSELTNCPLLSNASAISKSLFEEVTSLSPLDSSLAPTTEICVPIWSGSNGIMNWF